MIFKNTEGQGVYFYAHDTAADAPKTGDAANITGTVSQDGSTPPTAFATANPTEIGGGLYWQPLSQEESNADALGMAWESTTDGVQIDPLIVTTEKGRIQSGLSTLTAGQVKTTIEASGSILNLLSKLLQADVVIDTAVTPWALVHYERGTDTELLRQQIQDVAGTNIVSTSVIPGRLVE